MLILKSWMNLMTLSLHYPTGSPGSSRPPLQSRGGRAWVPVEDEPIAGRGRRSLPLRSQPGPPRSACLPRKKSPFSSAGEFSFKRGMTTVCKLVATCCGPVGRQLGENQETSNWRLLTFWLRAPDHMAARRRQLYGKPIKQHRHKLRTTFLPFLHLLNFQGNQN